MKSMRNIIALLLAVLLCLSLLAACGKQTGAQPEAPADGTEPDAEEIVAITFAFPDFNSKAESKAAMETALNEITEREIGVHVNLEPWAGGNYTTQVTLAVSGAEPLDLICLTVIPGTDVNTMHAQGELMDLSPYLNQDYASGLMDVVGKYLDAYTYADGVFGVPNFRNYSGSHFLVMRRDILDELALTEAAESMETWADYRAILEQVSAQTDLYATARGFACKDFLPADMDGSLYEGYMTDSLNDANQLLMVDADGQVRCIETDARQEGLYRYLAGLYEAGLMYPEADASMLNDDLMRDGVIFSYKVDSDMAVAVQKEQYTGYEILAVPFARELLTTTSINNWGMGIPVFSQEPEAAVKFLNLLYTDPEVMNLMVYGLEGEDFVVTEAGEADYPEGKDGNSVSWSAGNWLFGNTFLLTPWAGNGADFYTRSMADLAEAPLSPYMGFVPDVSELSSEVAALSTVTGTYHDVMDRGLYTEDLYAEYVDALDSAGIDAYIAAIQTQLDAWVAAQ